MNKEIYLNLLNNRILKDNQEIEKFEHNLEILADDFTEGDIIELCSVLDDKTHNSEVMFSVIHLLETLSSELAFENTIKGVVLLNKTSPEWASIIIYRCLNDEFSVQMLKKAYRNIDMETGLQFEKKLQEIKKEDEESFGKSVDEILKCSL